MTEFIHPVSLSSGLKKLTSIVSFTILASLVFIVYMITQNPLSITTAILVIVALALCLAVVCVHVLQPLAIEVTVDDVIIYRVMGKVTISRKDILQVRRKARISRDLRRFGSGGFCGYLGHFSSSDEGKYFAYVQDTQAMVYIRTCEKNFVVSCLDADNLVDELSN